MSGYIVKPSKKKGSPIRPQNPAGEATITYSEECLHTGKTRGEEPFHGGAQTGSIRKVSDIHSTP